MNNTASTTSTPQPIAQSSYQSGQMLPTVGSQAYNQAAQLASGITPPTTIPTSAITNNQTTPSLPTTAPNNGLSVANQATANVNALNTGQNALLSSTDSGVGSAEAAYNNDKSTVNQLMSQYLNKGNDQLQMEADAGIPALRTNSNNLTQQYLSQQGAYNSQYNQIYNRVGGTAAQKAAEINSLQQQNGYNLTNTGIQQSIAQNDYNNAQTLINHQIDIKYAPIKDTIDFGMQFLQQDQTFLTQKQTQSFEAALQVQQQMYTQSTYYDHLNADTSLGILKDATANGAPADVTANIGSIIARGGSASEVASAAGQYAANGQYTLAWNQSTNQLEPLNTKTGLFKDGGKPTPNTPTVNPTDPTSANTVTSAVGGTQYNLSTYAQDPQYALKVTAASSSIQTSVGAITSPTQANMYIAQNAPNSPITGDDVFNAATTAGVDPTTLLAQVKVESQLGMSNVAKNNNNYGGIKYAGQANATKGTVAPDGGFYAKFDTPKDGLDAEASELAKRKVPPVAATPQQQNKLAAITTLKASLPSYVGAAVGYTAGGDGYIAQDKITDPVGSPAGYGKTQASALSAKYGLPILSASQVETLQGADEALRNINEVIAPAWNTIAPNGTLGKLANQSTEFASKVGDTQFYNDNNTFSSNKENVAQQIRALSQAAPQLSLLSTAENALPDNTGYYGLGGKYDSKDAGNSKLTRTVDLLNQTIKTLLPNATPIPLDTRPLQVINGITYKINPDGVTAVRVK